MGLADLSALGGIESKTSRADDGELERFSLVQLDLGVVLCLAVCNVSVLVASGSLHSAVCRKSGEQPQVEVMDQTHTFRSRPTSCRSSSLRLIGACSQLKITSMSRHEFRDRVQCRSW